MRAPARDLSKPDVPVLPADYGEPAAKQYLLYDDHLTEEAEDEAQCKTIEIRLLEAEWLGDGALHAQCRVEMEQLLAVQIARRIRDIHNGFMSELQDLQKQLNKKHQLRDHRQYEHQLRGLKVTSQGAAWTALKTRKSAIPVMRQGPASGPDGLVEGTANGRGGVGDHVEVQCRGTMADEEAEMQALTSALADREDETRQMGAAMAASEEEVVCLWDTVAHWPARAATYREIEADMQSREAEVACTWREIEALRTEAAGIREAPAGAHALVVDKEAALAASEEEVACLRRDLEAQGVAHAGGVREMEAGISAREAEVVAELFRASEAREMGCRISVADREAKVRALTSALRESEAAGCSLRKAMAVREAEAACLRREVEDARVEAAQKHAAHVSSSAEVHRVLEALDASGRTTEAAEREKAAAESKCAGMEQMIRNRAFEVEVLRRRDVELTVEVEKCAEDLQRSKARLMRKHEHVVALRSRVANFEWSLELAFDDLRTAAKEQIQLMQTWLEGAERRLDEAVCELRGMATRMDEQGAELQRLTRAMAEWQARVSEAEEGLKWRDVALSALTRQVASREVVMQTEVSKRDAMLASRDEALAEARREAGNKAEALAKASQEAAKAWASLEATTQWLHELEKEHSEALALGALASIESGMAEKGSHLQTFQKDFTRTAAESYAMLAGTEEVVGGLRQEESEIVGKLAGLERVLTEKETAIEELRKEGSKQRAEAERQGKELRKCGEALGSKNAESIQLRAALDEARAAVREHAAASEVKDGEICSLSASVENPARTISVRDEALATRASEVASLRGEMEAKLDAICELEARGREGTTGSILSDANSVAATVKLDPGQGRGARVKLGAQAIPCALSDVQAELQQALASNQKLQEMLKKAFAMAASAASVEQVMDNLRMITLNLDRNFDTWKPGDAESLADTLARSAGVAKEQVKILECQRGSVIASTIIMAPDWIAISAKLKATLMDEFGPFNDMGIVGCVGFLGGVVGKPPLPAGLDDSSNTEQTSAMQAQMESLLDDMRVLKMHEQAAVQDAATKGKQLTEAMAVRDKAVASLEEVQKQVEELNAINTKLAGHSNAKQKVQHVVRMKEENNELHASLKKTHGELAKLRDKASRVEKEVDKLRGALGVGGGATQVLAAAAAAREAEYQLAFLEAQLDKLDATLATNLSLSHRLSLKRMHFVERLVKHWAHGNQAAALMAWKAHCIPHARIIDTLGRSNIQRWRNKTLSAAMEMWHVHVHAQWKSRGILMRMAASWVLRDISVAYFTWKCAAGKQRRGRRKISRVVDSLHRIAAVTFENWHVHAKVQRRVEGLCSKIMR